MEELLTKLAGGNSDLMEVEKYETTTGKVAMKLVVILNEKESLKKLISGRSRGYERSNGRIVNWTILPEWLRKFCCIGTARQQKLSSRVADFKIQDGYLYIVDIFSGDVVSFRDGLPPIVLAGKEKKSIRCRRSDGANKNKNRRFKFRVHHLVLYALDTQNELYDVVQRFTAWRGYYRRDKKCFIRPKDNCDEYPEELDENGDTLHGGTLSVACKTDGEHTLGFMFNCIWGLWKSHHAVNQWLHRIRERAGYWLHPYHDEKYAEKQEHRAYPSFYDKLPATLTEQLSEFNDD